MKGLGQDYTARKWPSQDPKPVTQAIWRQSSNNPTHLTPRAPRTRQTLWVITLKTHPCRAFLWALHGHSRAGRESAPSRPGEGCQAWHPGPGTRSSNPPKSSRWDISGTAAPIPLPHLGRGIGVGGAESQIAQWRRMPGPYANNTFFIGRQLSLSLESRPALSR